MDRAGILAFLREHRFAVAATTAPSGAPEAAVLGVAVNDALELIFDTLDSTRKCANLRRDARVAVVWWEGERTVQYEGVADEPTGEDRERCLATYLAAFPDGRERLAWPGITHFRVRPTWVRWSDFGGAAPVVEEIDAREAS